MKKRELVERVQTGAGRSAGPSYAIIDSQSAKLLQLQKNMELTEAKTKGRKRHIVVDIRRNLLTLAVHTTNIHNTRESPQFCVTAQSGVKREEI